MSATTSLVINDIFKKDNELKVAIDYVGRVTVRANGEYTTITAIEAFELALWLIRNIKVQLRDE